MARRPAYVTANRLARLRACLTADDFAVLAMLRENRVATGLQIQRRLFGAADDDALKQRRVRCLARLSQLGAIKRLERRIGGVHRGSTSSVYALDIAGHRLMDLDGRPRHPWTPSTAMLRHTVACTEVYVTLTEAERAGLIELLDYCTEPASWRQSRTDQGEAWTLKPDADVTLGIGDDELHWFVEVDLATESRPRITAKAKAYISYLGTGAEQQRRGVTPRVAWIVPDRDRVGQIASALARVDSEYWHLFAVGIAAETTALLSGHLTAEAIR